jgi:hypothetical protein
MLEDTYLISVYEKQSYEESLADYGGEDGAGYLFSIARYTRAQYEQYLGSDGSDQSFFAKDDNYYYGWFVPTDVQFYRTGGTISTESDDWKVWTELKEKCGEIRGDFIARNCLTAYSDSEFMGREFTYEGAHRYLTYYPYYAYQNAAAQQGFGWKDIPLHARSLSARRAGRTGHSGVWSAVRQLTPASIYEFPDATDRCAADYYTDLQSAADRGEDTSGCLP